MGGVRACVQVRLCVCGGGGTVGGQPSIDHAVTDHVPTTAPRREETTRRLAEVRVPLCAPVPPLLTLLSDLHGVNHLLELAQQRAQPANDPAAAAVRLAYSEPLRRAAHARAPLPPHIGVGLPRGARRLCGTWMMVVMGR